MSDVPNGYPDYFAPQIMSGDRKDNFDKSIMAAMSKYYFARQGAEFIGATLIPRLFPSKKLKEDEMVGRLDIMERRRRLGLPDNSDDYEEMLNSDKPLINPGRALTLGIVAATNKAPILRFGASPILKGMQHGAIGRGLGLVGKLFR